jgi:hypothetical protein
MSYLESFGFAAVFAADDEDDDDDDTDNPAISVASASTSASAVPGREAGVTAAATSSNTGQ